MLGYNKMLNPSNPDFSALTPEQLTAFLNLANEQQAKNEQIIAEKLAEENREKFKLHIQDKIENKTIEELQEHIMELELNKYDANLTISSCKTKTKTKNTKAKAKEEIIEEIYELNCCGARCVAKNGKGGNQCPAYIKDGGLCGKHLKEYNIEGNKKLRCGWWAVQGENCNNCSGFSAGHETWSKKKYFFQGEFRDARPEAVQEKYPLEESETASETEEASSSEEE